MIHILKSFFTYSYIVSTAAVPGGGLPHALIIDPAWDYANFEQHLTAMDLQGIFLTHHHFDHVNLVERIVRQWPVPVFMAQAEIDYYDFRCSHLQAITSDNPLTVGNLTLQPLLTPGHTRGGSCFWLEGSLFTGDTIFIEGCGACSFGGGNPHAMYDSVMKLKKIIPADTMIYPGHSYGAEPGKPFSFLLTNNIYFNFEDRTTFVAFRMRKSQKGLFDFK